ncbi:MAG: S1C family serine protease [Caldicoprobacterales bacterium]
MKRKLYWGFSCLLILIILLGLAGCSGEGSNTREEDSIRNDKPVPRAQQVKVEERVLTSGTVVEVAESIIPAVVGISTIEISRDSMWGEAVAIKGIGSGVVVHPFGYILTNDHVAGGNPSSISVVFSDGTELEGRTLWSDPTLDLAMVKVEAENDLVYAPLGNSEDLAIGETVVAIGTPLGLQFQHTVTSGIISGLNRTVKIPTNLGENFMEDLVQTDASINPGNSGGPLVNIRGEVIGINTVKVTSAEGIGFAIPIDVAKPIIRHFVEEGEFVTPYIGIVGFDREMASYYNRNRYIEEGIYVVELDKNGPAYSAGVRVGDIITMVGNQKVNKMLDLRKTIYSYRVGQSVDIRILRGGKDLTINMTLVEKPI